MPIYEYRCEACGHELEAMQKFSDAILTDCPSCGKPDLKKLVSAAAFQLKGNGWYATDFKGGGNKKTEEKTDSTADAKKTETKSETSAAKSEDSAGTPAASAKPGCGTGGCGCH